MKGQRFHNRIPQIIDGSVCSLSFFEIRLNSVLNFLFRISSSEKFAKTSSSKGTPSALASVETLSLPSATVQKLFFRFPVYGSSHCLWRTKVCCEIVVSWTKRQRAGASPRRFAQHGSRKKFAP